MQGPFVVLSRLSLTKSMHGHKATATIDAQTHSHSHTLKRESAGTENTDLLHSLAVQSLPQGGSMCSQNGNCCKHAKGAVA